MSDTSVDTSVDTSADSFITSTHMNNGVNAELTIELLVDDENLNITVFRSRDGYLVVALDTDEDGATDRRGSPKVRVNMNDATATHWDGQEC